MNAPAPNLPRTAAAVEAYDRAVAHTFDCAIGDCGKLPAALDAEDAAGCAIVVAFAAETADRNSEADVRRYMRWDNAADRAFIRLMVEQWRAS